MFYLFCCKTAIFFKKCFVFNSFVINLQPKKTKTAQMISQAQFFGFYYYYFTSSRV